MKFLNLSENTNIGNHEMTVNDLKQLSQADSMLQDALGMSWSNQEQGGVIIGGVEQYTYTQNTINYIGYSRGWIAKNNQFWRVEPMLPQPIDSNKEVYVIYSIKNTYVPVVYKSGQSFQVHQERVAELVYRTQSNQPTGTLFQDYALLDTHVAVERISDISARVDDNTAHRLHVQEQPWTILPNTLMTSMIINGLTGIGNDAQCRYKVIGRQLHLELWLSYPNSSQTYNPMELQLPNNLKMATSTKFSLIAYCSNGGNCRVEFDGSQGTGGLMLIHAPMPSGTGTYEVSFSVVLELR